MRLPSFFFGSTILLVTLAAPGMAEPLVDGFQLPAYGENIRVTEVYTGERGQLVLGYGYTAEDGAHAGFYDTASKTRLAAADERGFAREYKREAAFVTSRKLISLPMLFSVSSSSGNWSNIFLDGTKCTWPYRTAGQFEGPHNSTFWMIFVKLRQSEQRSTLRSCEKINKVVNLKLRYSVGLTGFYPAGTDGVYGQVGPYLIHFHADGTTRFFAERNDIALVDATKIERIIVQADSGREQQSFIIKTELLVQRTLKSQLRGKR
jgi:hypothetical protein